MLGIQTCHCQNVIVRETMISCRSNSATIYDINYFPDHSDEVVGPVPCKLSKNTTSVLVHHSTGQVWTRRSKNDFFNRFFQALCCESSSKVGFFGREMEVCCSTRLTPLRFNSARVQKVSFCFLDLWHELREKKRTHFPLPQKILTKISRKKRNKNKKTFIKIICEYKSL